MEKPIIAVVGPCAAGKSTLINGLKKYNITCKHITQEHSYVADMWKRITNPHILIYLDVGYLNTLKRKNLNWNENEYHEEVYRLRHAKENANLVIVTDGLKPDEVLDIVIDFLRSKNIEIGQP